MQNNLLELVSLLTFVMPRVFRGGASRLVSVFGKRCQPFLSKLTSAWTLIASSRWCRWRRRSWPRLLCDAPRPRCPPPHRSWQVLGSLPPKRCSDAIVKLTPMQRTAYDALVKDFRDRKAASAEAGGAGVWAWLTAERTERLSSLFMQLRKMALHPLLHRW